MSGMPTYKVEGLQEKEKLDIITGYMDLYGKTLNQEQTDLILNAKQSSNPLYLKALLDEVCQLIFMLFEFILDTHSNGGSCPSLWLPLLTFCLMRGAFNFVLSVSLQ